MVDDLRDRLRSLPPQDLPHPPDRHARVLRRARSHQRRVRAAAAVSTVLVIGGAVAALADTLPGTGGGAQLRAGSTAGASTGSSSVSSNSAASSGAAQTATPPAVSSPSPATSPASPGPTPACTSSVLDVTIAQSQGTAGTYFQTIRFQNTGATPCSLAGYPGVSFTDSNGVEVGQSAREDNYFAQPERTVVIPAGGATQATVGIPDTGAVPPSTCQARSVSEMRIYPPNQDTYTMIADRQVICTIGAQRPFVTPVGSAGG